MKERPILFSGPMVRAILEGRKTQTRRVGKIQCAEWTGLGVEFSKHATKGLEAVATHLAYPGRGTARHGICACPYGVPGKRLWVKETFATTQGEAIYREDPIFDSMDVFDWKWTPSIFMPRWASRITLEVEAVRVERLHQISEADASAEGVQHSCDRSDVDAYRALWNEINGPKAWDANPWVWVIQFRRLRQEGACQA